MRIAITGGIGSGKSHICRLLEQRGIEVFNCDIVAKTIIATHTEVRDELAALVDAEQQSAAAHDGAPAATAAHTLTKQALSAYIRRGPDCAARVNAIVHPRVAQAFERHCMLPAPDAVPHHWMECAILFESGFDSLVDAVVIVTCPTDERIRRIIGRDHCNRATALSWIALQMDDDERIDRARSRATHFIITNDGTTPLDPQIDALIERLNNPTP